MSPHKWPMPLITSCRALGLAKNVVRGFVTWLGFSNIQYLGNPQIQPFFFKKYVSRNIQLDCRTEHKHVRIRLPSSTSDCMIVYWLSPIISTIILQKVTLNIPIFKLPFYNCHLIKSWRRPNKKLFVCCSVILLARAESGMAVPKFSSNCSLFGTLYHGRNPTLLV